MAVYSQNGRKAISSGYCVGIIDLPWKVPYVPGDVTNATTYDFPVMYETCESLDAYAVADGDPSQAPAFTDAVRRMQENGVKGVSGDCGFFLNYLDVAVTAAEVPVFLSSLQLLPMLDLITGRKRSIAIFTPFPDKMKGELFAKTGFRSERRIVPVGLDSCEEFMEKLGKPNNSIDTDKLESELVELAKTKQEENPDLGVILFECSMLPPYAKAIRDATNLPVFDFVGMINLFQRASHREEFS